MIGAEKLVLQFPDYAFNPPECVKPIQFSLLLIETTGNTDDLVEIPDFITVDTLYRTITIFTTDPYDAGKTYKFYMNAKEPESGKVDPNPWNFSLSLVIKPFNRPKITKIASLNVTERVLQVVRLATLFDNSIDMMKLKIKVIKLGIAYEFCEFNSDSLTLTIHGDRLSTDLTTGSYAVTLAMSDTSGQHFEFILNIDITFASLPKPEVDPYELVKLRVSDFASEEDGVKAL